MRELPIITIIMGGRGNFLLLQYLWEPGVTSNRGNGEVAWLRNLVRVIEPEI